MTTVTNFPLLFLVSLLSFISLIHIHSYAYLYISVHNYFNYNSEETLLVRLIKNKKSKSFVLLIFSSCFFFFM